MFHTRYERARFAARPLGREDMENQRYHGRIDRGIRRRPYRRGARARSNARSPIPLLFQSRGLVGRVLDVKSPNPRVPSAEVSFFDHFWTL